MRFVGRQDEMSKLEEAISTAQGPQKLAITGLGGVGKTQVALELAYRMQDRDPECSIFWIPCTSHKAVKQALMTIAEILGISNVNSAEMKEHIKVYFARKDWKWLLIFDNADDMDMWMEDSSISPPLKDLLPDNNQGHIVFTTRNRKLAVKLASSDVIHVRELDEKAGVEFLGKSLIQKSLLNDSHLVLDLLEQLTFLPLAIAQAAAYMNENSIGISDYLLLLQEQEADVVELLSEDFGDDGRYKEIQNPVAMTWQISFQQVQKLDQLACDYLSLMACVVPHNIPESFLPPPASKKKKTDALGLLSAYSFITIQPETASISLHRLVHLATRNWMKKEDQFPRYIETAADRLKEIFPDGYENNQQLWIEYLPHALALTNEQMLKVQQELHIDYIRNVGIYLNSDGGTNETGKLLEEVVEVSKRVLGPKHLETLSSMENLAAVYWNEGKCKEAEELDIQVLETRRSVQGPTHPATVSAMSSLALVYTSLGRWKEAEELERQVVKHRNQAPGPEHPITINSMELLAKILKQLGNTSEALTLLKTCANLRDNYYGPNHPLAILLWNRLEEWEIEDNTSRYRTREALAETSEVLAIHTPPSQHELPDQRDLKRLKRSHRGHTTEASSKMKSSDSTTGGAS